jgi:hypothetical protein
LGAAHRCVCLRQAQGVQGQAQEVGLRLRRSHGQAQQDARWGQG